MKNNLLIAFLLLASLAKAQIVAVYNTIAMNKIKHTVFADGELFSRDGLYPYNINESPIGSGKNSVYNGDLWMGGTDNGGNLKIAAGNYLQGPIDTLTMLPDTIVGAQFNRVWKINRSMIEYHQSHFQNGVNDIPEQILSWPGNGTGGQAHILAPFVDLNNNTIYEPLLGEYPELKGDEMLYCIFNDLLPENACGAFNIGAEIHLTVYAYTCPDVWSGSDNEAVNNSVFYNYKVFNRSNFTVSNFYTGWFQEPLLGTADDFIGCDTTRNAGFVYNGDNDDNYDVYGYGENPPMQSYVQLGGPLAYDSDGLDNNHNGNVDEAGEEVLFTNFMKWNNDFTNTGNPENCVHIYNYLRSVWKDSYPLSYGGNGYNGSVRTRYAFPTLPYTTGADTTNWNEQTEFNFPSGRRFLMSCGPTTFHPHTSFEYTYAIVFSHYADAPNGATTSLALNNIYVDKVREWYNAQQFPSCTDLLGVDAVVADLTPLTVFPNPANTMLNITLDNTTTNLNYRITDMAGKTLLAGNNLPNKQPIDISMLAQGIYLLNITAGQKVYYSKFVRE